MRLHIAAYLGAMEKIGFHGTVLVEQKGQLLLSRGYGFADRERQQRNTAETVFDIGSITKQFTAAAILKLEMQGKLSTEDPLTRYFANVPADKQQITIHDMLRHQSGLVGNVGGDYEAITTGAFIDSVLNAPLEFSPGSGFSYSNVGYSLLAIIVERVSRSSWESYLYEQLWKPAGMEHTGYSRPAFDREAVAIGYDEEQVLWGLPTEKAWDGNAPFRHLLGNGGVLSTTADLLRWHHALLGTNILSYEAKQKYYHPILRADEDSTSYYAYGWDVSLTEWGSRRFWHNGTNRVFYADYVRFPEDEVVIIVLCNNAHQYFARIAFEIARILFRPSYQPVIPPPDNATNRAFTQRIINALRTSDSGEAQQLFDAKAPDEMLLEYRMRQEGFESIDRGESGLALRLFAFNVRVYPGSAKALQALGEGYMETGNNEEALKYFRRSLDLEPENPFVRDMLVRLTR
ncbi:MAG: serine hydrolase [Bacteroidia bacterium]|nr:serine hydrolase [Bacteroidia bacterium]